MQLIRHNFGVVLLTFAAAGALALTTPEKSIAQSTIVVDLASQDLIFSPLEKVVYASVPNSSPTNPNTLTPIDIANGALGSPIAIGFNPRDIVISNDGTTIHTVFGGNVGVQPFDVPSQTFGTPFFIPDGPEVKELYAIPDRPTAVLVAVHWPKFNPPAITTAVWEDSVKLPEVVGMGLGVGGPDLIAMDPVDGTEGYGYQNTVSSFDNWNLNIHSNGVSAGGPTLQGLLRGFDVERIERHAGRIFTDLGEVFNISPPFQTGAFQGFKNFVIDPHLNKLFSINSVGNTHTLFVYDLTTIQFLDSVEFTGSFGTTMSLTRFGSRGLAFRTTNNQVVLLTSDLVPNFVCSEAGVLLEGTGEANDFNASCASDDVYWGAHGSTFFFAIDDPVTQFELRTKTSNLSPEFIEVDIEAKKEAATADLILTAQLFNWSTGEYETGSLPGTMLLTTTDSKMTFNLVGDPSDFVGPPDGGGDGEIRVRFQTIQTGGPANVRTLIDEVLFNID